MGKAITLNKANYVDTSSSAYPP